MAVVAWPPPTPPNSRANATPIVDAHPSDHNRIADALDTLIARINAPARFRVIGGGAGQSVPSGAPTGITWAGGAEQVDTDNAIAIGTGVFTCPTGWPGRWRFDFQQYIASTGVGHRGVWMADAATNRYGGMQVHFSVSSDFLGSGSAELVLTAGQTVQCIGLQTAAGSIAFNNSAAVSYFQGRWVGGA